MTLDCDECDFSCKNAYKYLEHLETHGIQSRIKYRKYRNQEEVCYICGTKYKNYYLWKTHKEKSCPVAKIKNLFSSIIDDESQDGIIQFLINKRKTNLESSDIPLPNKTTTGNTSTSSSTSTIDNHAIFYNSNNTNNNTNSNNKTINNNIKIDFNIDKSSDFKLNNLFEENLDVLDDGELRRDVEKTLGKILPNPVKSLRKFDPKNIKKTFDLVLEKIYCNKDFRENHNLYISDKESHRKFKVFLDNKWQKIGDLKMIEDVVIRLKDIIKDLVIEMLDETINTSDNQEEVDYFLDYKEVLLVDLDLFIKNISGKNICTKKKVLKQFFLKLYNFKDLISESYNLTNN